MPKVKDKLTGDVISNQPYTAEGTQRAEQIAESDPNWEMDYAPGGKESAMNRSKVTYAGGGKTGYNVPQPRMDDAGILEYKKGGKTGPKGEKIPKGSSVSSLKQRANIKKSKRKKGEKPAPPFSTRFGRSILDEDKK